MINEVAAAPILNSITIFVFIYKRLKIVQVRCRRWIRFFPKLLQFVTTYRTVPFHTVHRQGIWLFANAEW